MWRDDAYLLDMLVAARRALKFSNDLTLESLAKSDLYQNAILHVLQIIGEAATKVSPQFKEEHPEIQWVKVIAMRHRLVHDYRRIEVKKVWEAVQSGVPELIEQLNRLVPPEEEE
jgi:uncharacterized protein with HEPN domain